MTEPGEVLAGRYRLVELLGRGGMGSVWRAEHVELGSQVAVKLIAEGIATSETALGRFRREAKAAAALSSPHVVQIFDYGVDNNVPYIAMELLHGESLAQRLKVRRTLPQAEVARLLTHVARAIDKAHRAGILHRDMKPDNVFICKGEDEDDEDTVKVLDFGVAKALKPDVVGTLSSHTRTGALVGSPYYMSPEQIRGQKTIDHHGDLWSIGVIAYECLIGKRPFEGESIGDLVMTVCSDPIPVPSEHGCKLAGFDGWFAKACARDPKERFDSAREMANAFRALMGQGVLDEETRDSVEESMAGPPMATTLEESATVPAAAPFAAPDTPATAAGAATATATAGVQTASGLTRTQDGPTGARRPARGGKVGLALGAGVLVAGVAVAALLVSRVGSGDRSSTASSGTPTESALVSSVPSPPRPAPLPSANAAGPSSASSAPSAAPSPAVPSSVAPKSKPGGDAAGSAHPAAPATAAAKSPAAP